MKKIMPYQISKDKRGFLLGIINSDKWEEINYVETLRNEFRGGHYHKETKELFFIIDGRIEVRIRNIFHGDIESFIVTKGDIFIVEPFELHEFICLENSNWINILSKKMDDKEPDFWKV